jgi:hypothetical protein
MDSLWWPTRVCSERCVLVWSNKRKGMPQALAYVVHSAGSARRRTPLPMLGGINVRARVAFGKSPSDTASWYDAMQKQQSHELRQLHTGTATLPNTLSGLQEHQPLPCRST